MLKLEILLEESFDENTMEFITTSAYTLELEHSLVSLSKWEQKYEKPFLSNDEKTTEETFGYINAMSLTGDIPEAVLHKLTNDQSKQISDYINGKQTATWFREDPNRPRGHEIITAEIIYYWMLSLNVSKEHETWHLNRLITLIRVVNEKNAPPKKTNPRDMAQRRSEINRQRLQAAQARANEGGTR